MNVKLYGGPAHGEVVDDPVGVSIIGWPQLWHDELGARRITQHQYELRLTRDGVVGRYVRVVIS